MTIRHEALAMVAEDAARSTKNIVEFVEQLGKVEEGLHQTLVTSPWHLRWQNDIEIAKEFLPLIRKITGRLQLAGNMLTYDYENSNEIYVRLRPMSKEFDKLTFRYRTKLRPNSKCHVETRVTTDNTLVCRK